MAFDSRVYRDPSNICDTLRRLDRKMSGCKKCRYEFVIWETQGCTEGKKPDEDGYCEAWKQKWGMN